MSAMARYTVKFAAGERSGSFLIPLSPVQPCSAMIDAVKSRLSTLQAQEDFSSIKEADATLHLEDADGPVLYAGDALQDVLPGGKETVIVVFELTQTGKAQPPAQTSQIRKDSLPVGVPSLRIRLVSPKSARISPISTIEPLQDAIPLSSTLAGLKARVQTHLGLPADDGTPPDLECNSNLSRKIGHHAAFKRGKEAFEAAHTVIVVHGNHSILTLPVDGLYKHVLEEAALNLIQPGQALTFVGAPFLAICSKKQHAIRNSQSTSSASEDRDLIVDLRNSECPIDVTAHNASISLADAGLADCAIDGILTIFVVQRWASAKSELTQGKAGIFQKSAAWEHPCGQSDLGISNLMSTLRVFTHLPSGGNMDDEQQDAVLHILGLLTRFPPAIRAAYILMRGETSRSSERAALAQSLYEVLKAVVPLRVVSSSPLRFFEGSRLLFAPNDLSPPYVGMSVYDLRNMITMDPALSTPVQTKAGLLDIGFYKAFEEGGFLIWTNNNNTAKASIMDSAWSRMAILSDGTNICVVQFNLDAVNTSNCYVDRGDINAVISAAEYSDLSYLAGLCGRNQLSVIPPSALPSATAPVLTLDREGSLSLVTPDEIAVICVDLSRSMLERCGFVDVQDSEDADAQVNRSRSASSKPTMRENPTHHLPDVDELKEYLKTHESFDDFLTIIRAGHIDYQRRLNAEKVLQIIQHIDALQIEAKTKELEKPRNRTTHYLYRMQVYNLELGLNTPINRSLRLKTCKSLISARLLTCLGPEGASAYPLVWRPGEPIPKLPKRLKEQAGTNVPKFQTPREYCCHISSEIMEDPVLTEDNFTYERKDIERWFQSNETSSLTNLVLPNLDSRPNLQMKEAIVKFISGKDITSKYKALRRDTHLMRVTMKSSLDTWSLLLPRQLMFLKLWELAFRLTKGRYSSFELQHHSTHLATSRAAISTAVNPERTVFITPVDSETPNAVSSDMQEICLVKIYDSTFSQPVVSYWEPRSTTRSLGSSVFKYYRAKLLIDPWINVDKSFVLWTALKDVGDGQLNGTIIDGPWDLLSKYFTPERSTGVLTNESCVAKIDDAGHGEIFHRGRDGNQPLVFKMAIAGPPSTGKNKRNQLSRLDVLKQMFDAFINRLLAYNFQTYIGLVTFGSKATIAQGITNAVENFRHKLNNLTATGDTAMWDSIALAQDQLQAYAEKYPSAKLRNICILDGEDNKSEQNMVNVAARLYGHGITLDAFCLGDAANADLQTVSYLTKGYTFEPKTLEEAMAICELEPVLSSLERPEPKALDSDNEDAHCYREAFHIFPSLGYFRMANEEVTVEHISKDIFPKRKENPQLADEFVELGTFNKHSTQARTDGNLRLSRVHTEIRNSGAHTHPHYDIYINDTYAGGTFLLYIDMGADYPMFAPTARFVTPIYHPNINRHGRICHSILDRNWTVDTSNKDLLDTIYSLLLVPKFSDPINTVVTLNYHWDEVQFKEEAQRHIQKHASKLRAEWRGDIVG
ncbi:peptidylprolyl isomerase [Parastagonospora nodorum]|nr:peptidylprolyl isomerase [Parastagonospora nodorum]KAH6305024.1 peptidylprolyl isomerase [Parastagonospora nodorum]